METTPFVYGRMADGGTFTGRDEEMEKLAANFTHLINTIVISPRRWGKTSVVKRAAQIAMRKDPNLRFCFIDLFTIRKEEDFHKLLAESLLKSQGTKWDQLMVTTKKMIKQLLPKLSFTPGHQGENEFELGLDWNEVKKNPGEILNLAQKIADTNKIKLVVCIDEFQNIGTFEDPLAFQKMLRSYWQHHGKVAYCLYGSKRNMMMEVFGSPQMPFYKFGDLFFLEKMNETIWTKFIVKRFKDTGKKIEAETAALIPGAVENHSYYVQQLSQIAWVNTDKICSEKIIHKALESLMHQLGFMFQTQVEHLTTPQINLLQAILSGEKQLSSKDCISKYNLGSSAGVLKMKKALIEKEIIDEYGGAIHFCDPIFKHWMRKVYFKMKN